MKNFPRLLAATAVAFLGTASAYVGTASASKPNPNNGLTTARPDSGAPNSGVVTDSSGQIIKYGSSSISYQTPAQLLGVSQAQLEHLGKALYMQNCSSCHGEAANGVPYAGTPGAYPNLVGLGPAVVDFWIESGRMPAANPTTVQAVRAKSVISHADALAIAAWVNSLQAGYPLVPQVKLSNASISNGAALFALNCAACHTITGGGDALANGTYAPSLHKIPKNQVVEAIRTGPGNMPMFTGNLSDAQVRDIVAYVSGPISHPQNDGGLGLGGLGPVAEGFIGLAIGVGVLALLGFWVGERNNG
jgi:ubiquinol-cytochrome c reductase cytochrome c subunit